MTGDPGLSEVGALEIAARYAILTVSKSGPQLPLPQDQTMITLEKAIQLYLKRGRAAAVDVAKKSLYNVDVSHGRAVRALGPMGGKGVLVFGGNLSEVSSFPLQEVEAYIIALENDLDILIVAFIMAFDHKYMAQFESKGLTQHVRL